MKKIIAITLAAGSTALLAACGSSHEAKTNTAPPVNPITASPTPTPSGNTPLPRESNSISTATPSPSLSSLSSALENKGGITATPSISSTEKKRGSAATEKAPEAKATTPPRKRATGASGNTGSAKKSAPGRGGGYSYTPPRSYVAPKAVKAPAPRNSGSISSKAVYPTRITINKIGMNKSINAMGLTARGLLDPRPGRISWYNRTPVPGKPGNSVLLGHVTYNFYPDAFYNLPKLNSGDKITITYSNGAKRTFTVYAKASVGKQALRTDKRVWGGTSTPTLVLVTCDVNSRLEGRYHRTRNLVVWAK